MSHFGQRLPYTRTPFGPRNIMQTEINEPKEGDYFCTSKNGEDWPIVIGDEEIIQTFFTQVSRPRSARRADGTWEKDYKTAGFSVSDRCFPAINLGTMELTWASLQELEPIDIDMGRAIRSSTTNLLLAKAWSEYIDQYKGDKIHEWKYLDHWKARLNAQRPERTSTKGSKKEKMPLGKKYQALKRKGTPTFRYPPGYRNEEMDDEESDDLFLPKGDPAGPKIKRESINSFSSEEIDALYDDADPPYPTSSQSSKRSKLDLSGRFSIRPSTSSRADTSKLTTAMPSLHRGMPSQSTNKNIGINDPDTVIIYVDNPHKRFRVKRSGLDTSPLLSKLLTHHAEDGWYIMSPMLSSIDAHDFQPVGEYIDRREYDPNILDDGTVHVRLEGDLGPDLLRAQVVRCATVYQVAKMLDMPGLEDLAFRKLRALAPHHGPREMLTVTERLFGIGGVEVRRYLTEHVAGHFWSLVLAETEKMAEVMGADRDLAEGVYGLLSGRLGDEKVKMEDKQGQAVKEEEEEEEEEGGAKDASSAGNKTGEKAEEGKVGEVNDGGITTRHSTTERTLLPRRPPTASSNNNNEKKKKKNNQKANNNNECLSQAEKDMLRMALRHDEEETSSAAAAAATNEEEGVTGLGGYAEEDDWVQLVQKQSDLFEAF